jgi:aminomuconate-semialdehyde/2-hydroxymuconate-6-semialdehyde dehydrogenase
VITHVIDGKARKAADGGTFETVDPWRQAPWEEVARGTRDDVDAAVAAARRAFADGPWPRMGYAERGRILHRLADLIEANAGSLAEADTSDMGKPLSDMLTCGHRSAAWATRVSAGKAATSRGSSVRSPKPS